MEDETVKQASDSSSSCALEIVASNGLSTQNSIIIRRLSNDFYVGQLDDYETDNTNHDEDEFILKTLVDHSWSKRILGLVGNKAKLMESFSWLSTVGGGYSALGEKDSRFSHRAGTLSLGQQLHLAELLGDKRLKVMCHLFAALAAIQLANKQSCFNYIRRVIVPLMNSLPYRDPILTNILKHILFRLSTIDYPKRVRLAIKSRDHPANQRN